MKLETSSAARCQLSKITANQKLHWLVIGFFCPCGMLLEAVGNDEIMERGCREIQLY